jgi:hypothetical protein
MPRDSFSKAASTVSYPPLVNKAVERALSEAKARSFSLLQMSNIITRPMELILRACVNQSPKKMENLLATYVLRNTSLGAGDVPLSSAEAVRLEKEYNAEIMDNIATMRAYPKDVCCQVPDLHIIETAIWVASLDDLKIGLIWDEVEKRVTNEYQLATTRDYFCGQWRQKAKDLLEIYAKWEKDGRVLQLMKDAPLLLRSAQDATMNTVRHIEEFVSSLEAKADRMPEPKADEPPKYLS